MKLPDQRTRAYVYRVLVAVGSVLVLHGFVTGEELTVYLAVAAELLGVGLAVANTSTKPVN